MKLIIDTGGIKFMINDNRNYYRKHINIPRELVSSIDEMAKKYSYTTQNKLYIELLELGILKFNENFSLRNTISNLVGQVQELIEILNSKK